MIDVVGLVSQLRRDFGLPVDPARFGPVPLNRFFEEMNAPRVAHFALPTLTLGKIESHLRAEGVQVAELGEANLRVDGLLFRRGAAAWAYVCDDERNPLPRRRFTAAHELGHAVMHGDVMGQVLIDETIDPGAAGQNPLEREANRFAAELLMPREICFARAEELHTHYGAAPRGVLIYRLAAELLVSAEALKYRLAQLEVGDE